jgi:hypothetical protein
MVFALEMGLTAGETGQRDAYSSLAPYLTSDIFKGPCFPIFLFVFPTGLMRLITVRYLCNFM